MNGKEIFEGSRVRSKYGTKGIIIYKPYSNCNDVDAFSLAKLKSIDTDGVFFIRWNKRGTLYILDGYEGIIEVIDGKEN